MPPAPASPPAADFDSPAPPLWTGQLRCYDARGRVIPCDEAPSQDPLGDDAPRGLRPADASRFESLGELVRDRLTGLFWTANANPFGFPLPWREALAAVAAMNAEAAHDRTDWRLPNRRELRSLMDHAASKPALAGNADLEAAAGRSPFHNVFQHWCWTSTTASRAPAYAWRIHLAGARMFYGHKGEESMVWPVAGASGILPRTGQSTCWDEQGRPLSCEDASAAAVSGMDGAARQGVPWPEPRFVEADDAAVTDRLTGLHWRRAPAREGVLMSWEEALRLGPDIGEGWRLPTINELESLVDCAAHDPALPAEHPFVQPQEAYWSATTSGYETDWAFCLYLHKGAVGVGWKGAPEFAAWLCKG